jgi:glutaredoxin
VYLREKGIDYEEKDVNVDAEARNEFLKRGLRGVPSFLIDDEVVVGLDKGRIEALLGL